MQPPQASAEPTAAPGDLIGCSLEQRKPSANRFCCSDNKVSGREPQENRNRRPRREIDFHPGKGIPSWAAVIPMTAIFGISAFYYDSAAALVVDGEIVAAAQEERFTRRKHDRKWRLGPIILLLFFLGLLIFLSRPGFAPLVHTLY